MASSGTNHVIGWRLDPEQRRQLLRQIRPVYRDVIADHVTLASKVDADAPLPSETGGEILGKIDDDAGLQALVVAIGGTTGRPDGGTYHITWSLGEGREAKESNDVIAQRGWTKFDLPEPVTLHPSDL